MKSTPPISRGHATRRDCGFRATGVHPLSRSAIKHEKLQASGTFHPEQHQQRLVEQSKVMSPVMRPIFTQFFLEQKSKVRNTTGVRMIPKHYGKDLTKDEAFD